MVNLSTEGITYRGFNSGSIHSEPDSLVSWPGSAIHSLHALRKLLNLSVPQCPHQETKDTATRYNSQACEEG